eukprot:jgi/Tetstr1/420923/TSEL_011984.t1
MKVQAQQELELAPLVLESCMRATGSLRAKEVRLWKTCSRRDVHPNFTVPLPFQDEGDIGDKDGAELFMIRMVQNGGDNGALQKELGTDLYCGQPWNRCTAIPFSDCRARIGREALRITLSGALKATLGGGRVSTGLSAIPWQCAKDASPEAAAEAAVTTGTESERSGPNSATASMSSLMADTGTPPPSIPLPFR